MGVRAKSVYNILEYFYFFEFCPLHGHSIYYLLVSNGGGGHERLIFTLTRRRAAPPYRRDVRPPRQSWQQRAERDVISIHEKFDLIFNQIPRRAHNGISNSNAKTQKKKILINTHTPDWKRIISVFFFFGNVKRIARFDIHRTRQ